MEVRNEIWKKILVWNGIWNGRKLPARNTEKSSSIPYHALVASALPSETLLGNVSKMGTAHFTPRRSMRVIS